MPYLGFNTMHQKVYIPDLGINTHHKEDKPKNTCLYKKNTGKILNWVLKKNCIGSINT